MAKDFETFIRSLVSSDIYDTSKQDLINIFEKLKTGRFFDILQEYFKKDKTVNYDKVLRNLFTDLTKEKGYFGLHSDDLSYLAYDIQFYLLSINKTIKTKEEFEKEYPLMVAMGNNEISTHGYATFFLNWFDQKVLSKEVKKKLFGGLAFTNDYRKKLIEKVRKYE